MDDEAVMCDQNHRHYDLKCEKMVPGAKFPSRAQGLEVLLRRRQARLAVSRIPFLEPLGAKRENYHQQILGNSCVGATVERSPWSLTSLYIRLVP